ncbi:MAG: cupin domain-containing protein [Acidimicrobiales bacterium]
MPMLITAPTIIDCVGDPPKQIAEFVGRASTGTTDVSVARMRSPAGWSEPAQIPSFTEVTYVISGTLVIDHDGGPTEVPAGSAVVTNPGEKVRYRTPENCEYVAICIPAFSPETVNRQE